MLEFDSCQSGIQAILLYQVLPQILDLEDSPRAVRDPDIHPAPQNWITIIVIHGYNDDSHFLFDFGALQSPQRVVRATDGSPQLAQVLFDSGEASDISMKLRHREM